MGNVVVRKKNKIEISMGEYDEDGMVIQISEDIGDDTIEIIDLVSPADARAVAHRLLQLADQWESNDIRSVLVEVSKEASESGSEEVLESVECRTD